MSENKVISVPLNAEARLEIAGMVYSRWCKAHDAMKETQARTWEQNKQVCPKSDWPLFYAENVKYAEAELAKATRLKDAFCPFSPLVFGE